MSAIVVVHPAGQQVAVWGADRVFDMKHMNGKLHIAYKRL